MTGGGEWQIWKDIPPEREEQPAPEATTGGGESNVFLRSGIGYEAQQAELAAEEAAIRASLTAEEGVGTVFLPPVEALQRARNAMSECPVPENSGAKKPRPLPRAWIDGKNGMIL